MNKHILLIGIIATTCTTSNSFALIPDVGIQCMLTTEFCASQTICEVISGTNYQGCNKGLLDKDECKCYVIAYATYQCNNGYYGTPTNLSSKPTCTRCPALNGIYGTSVAGSNATQNDCYIPKNTTSSDASGSYTITGTCYY